MSDSHGTRAIVAAMSANLGIAATKAVAWLLTGSSSMMAESIHSLADTSNQVMMLLGSRRSRRQPDELHQFGYGRSRYIAAFLVSIVLFSLGGLFALYEAFHKFTHPEAITSWQWVPVVVLLVSCALEGRSLWVALHSARGSRAHLSLAQYVRQSRSPEIPVIIMEDVAALTGLVVALVGVSMTLVTGDGRWDAAGSGAIGALLVLVALFLASEVGSMLIGESATPEVQEAIRAAILGGNPADEGGAGAGVDGAGVDGAVGAGLILSLRTLHTGPDTVLVAARFAVDPHASGSDIARAIEATEARIRAAVPMECLIYLEPDLGTGA